MTSPREPHRLDGLSADQISTLPLPGSGLGRRGYDKHAVDAALAELAAYIDGLRIDIAAVTRTLRYREREIDHRRYGVELPAGQRGELIHEEQLAWHLDAQRYGDQITELALVQAEQIVEDAHVQAHRIVTDQVGRATPARPNAVYRSDELRRALGSVRELLAQVGQQVDRVDAAAEEWVQGNPR
jgi:hypothetical protein